MVRDIVFDAELIPGSGRAGCQTCRRVFISAALFDSHLREHSCAWSDSRLSGQLGLVLSDAGVWATEGQIEKMERFEDAKRARKQ